MSVLFTQSDLQIFQIPGFKDRMTALKEKIRPKLLQLGEEIAPPLMTQFKTEFFVHVAKHLRRKVNPPDETWLALGPQSRGYKAYVHFAFCIGKRGAQARVVMKDESPERPLLGKNLEKNLSYFEKQHSRWKGLADYTRRDSDYEAFPMLELEASLHDVATKLQDRKTAQMDIGLEINPLSKTLDQDFLKAVDLLYPFYLCGLHKGVQLK